jgi:hypothetical protein
VGKRLALACGIVLVLGLLGRGVFWLAFEHQEPAPVLAVPVVADPLPRAAAPDERIVIVEVEGKVERSLAGIDWIKVVKGDALQPEEAIRTDENGRLVLDVGQAATVDIGPQSKFSVREIKNSIARVELDEGRLGAVVHGEGNSRLRVETRGSEAIAESAGGDFAVLASGRGQMSVATRAGTVRLSVKDKSVVVSAGEQSTAKNGLAPSAPQAIPGSLFLKVNRPSTLVQREKQAAISGTSIPGAVISVNGVRVETDERGEFTALVPLAEGKNELRVEALDVLGHLKSTALPSITVKSQIADVQTKMTWGSKKKEAAGSIP